MEPVVQTSRIRLAIASVQLFIQRCLLNLELKVHPSLINARHWEWMKRYRVWEANRKIFLFPENWLEPEFRDDKTHLFAELEGALLQGDVSSDLVEDAFLNYLKKLDELARLDIVAMHIEDNPDPAQRTLHVIGRTYSEPYKYFYRRYSHQTWTPWEPVSAEIEGEHLAPIVWRDRLYVFWVTFMEKADPNSSPEKEEVSTSLTALTLQGAVTCLKSVVATKQVDVQLHWSEYMQGEWSTRESGGFAASIPTTVDKFFDPKCVLIHVSKAYEAGEVRGVYVHLGGPIRQAFYLASRNSSPEARGYSENNPWGTKPANPYSANSESATRYSGRGTLNVTFKQRIRSGRVANQIPLWRLYQANSGDHFYTTYAEERDKAIQDFGYVSEGIACHVLPVGDGAGFPLYRLYNNMSNDHFYTTSAAEHDKAIQDYGYVSEGVACHVLPVGDDASVPLYRLFSSMSSDHFYTTSAAERDNAVQNCGYVSEGIACAVVLCEEHTETKHILDPEGDYKLLPCDNNLTALGVSEDAYQDATNPAAVNAAIELGLGDIASLMKPVFYEDNAHTFFVESSVTERTIEEWQEWVTRTPRTEPGWRKPGWWKDLVVLPEIPRKSVAPGSRDQIAGLRINPGSLINPKSEFDWLVNPGTGLLFDGVLVGPADHPGLEMTTAKAAGVAMEDRTQVNVNPGSGLAFGSAVFPSSTTPPDKAGLTQVAGGLNVVGRGGFNAGLMKNFKGLNRLGFRASIAGAGRLGR
jgi:hypothetical protein